MSKSKFLSPFMLGTYASLAAMAALATPFAPVAIGLGLVALGRSGVSAAVQAFSAKRNPLISSPFENMEDEDLSNDELSTDHLEEWAGEDTSRTPTEDLEQSPSSNSRELLTNAPTPSPIQIINCNPSGAGSWSAALISAISSGGTINIGATAVGCIINLNANTNNVNKIVDIDLAQTGTAGLTVKSFGKFITSTGSNPAGFNFFSSSGTGNITFSDICFYQNGAGVFNFTVGSGVTATFSNGASIVNYAGSNVNIDVKSNGTMIWKDQGYIQNNPFVGGGGMTTNVDTGGALIMANGAYFIHQGAGAGIANIQGLLSMDTGYGKPFNTGFYNMKVIVGSNGTLASGMGGSGFAGSDLALTNATHQVKIGNSSYPPSIGFIPS